jgi:hypothetical protein
MIRTYAVETPREVDEGMIELEGCGVGRRARLCLGRSPL